MPGERDGAPRSTGVSDEQALAAAEHMAVFGSRPYRIDIKLNILIALGVSTLVGIGLILLSLSRLAV